MRTTLIKPLIKLVLALGLGAAATLLAAETRQAQTITFVTPTSYTLAQSPLILGATASSGLPVTYSSELPQYCTVSGSTVTLLAMGNCRITASQAGDALYGPAPNVTQEFYLLQARQSIVFPGLTSRPLNSEPFVVSATATSGLAVLFTSGTPALCTVTTDAQGITRVTLLATGTCKIKANQPGNATYSAAVQSTRSFAITAASGVQVYYVHPDQIGSPRAITSSADNRLVWQWKNEEVFGDNEADEDPLNTGIRFVYNLRFPGQVHDKETGTNQNYFRDYRPNEGRYDQSDLIGLWGGISTYGYVRGLPLSLIDPMGLDVAVIVNGPTSGNPFGHAAIAVPGAGVYSFGNATALGASLTNYLEREAGRRDTEVRILPTTPEQDQKVLDYLQGKRDDVGYFDNCAVRTTSALRAGGVSVRDPNNTAGFPEGVRRAMNNLSGVSVIIPRYGAVPSSLSSFNPSP